MDQERAIAIEPDLSWIEDGQVVFVGDAKYKRVRSGGPPNADIYQLHAYVTSLALSCGLLIYAEGEERETSHTVRHTGTNLIVRTLDVDGPPAEVLANVRDLAELVKNLRGRTEANGALIFSATG